MSRALPLCLLATSVGCSGPVDAPAERVRMQPPLSEPWTACEAREPSRCSSIEPDALDELPADGALVRARLAVGAVIEDDEGRSIGVPKIAIYEDGTVRRTPILRDARFLATPPRGLVVARLHPDTLARVRAEIAAIRAEDMRAFEHTDVELGPGEADLFSFPKGTACMPRPSSRTRCGPASLATLRATFSAVLETTERKWREARAGTVSLGRPLTVSGQWPLDHALAKDGFLEAGEVERRLVAGGELFRLSDGDFVRVEASTRFDDQTHVYITRVSPVVLNDEPLASELLANAGRYVASRGEWLGIPLDERRFVEMKERELAIVPASEDAPERVFELFAVEQLDLTNDGLIAVP